MTTSLSGLQTRPDLSGRFGMCASTHWTASGVAQSVLERGGNAFDAVVAAGFVLHVVEPHLNGPGGDLVALVVPAGGRTRVLCGQGPAPRGATIEHYRAAGLPAVPGSGALAAAVPGAVDAWLLLLAELGTMGLGEVLDYAVDYAEHGVPLLASAAATIAAVSDLFVGAWPSSAQLWLVDGRAPVAGEVLANPTYAATLRRLRDEAVTDAGPGADRRAVIEAARRVWSGGFVAEAVDRFVAGTPHLHATGGVHRGVLRAQDMAGFAAHLEDPVSVPFRGRLVEKAGPWSSGPVLLQALALLDGVDDRDLDLDTAGGIHTVVEAVKLAMADREGFYGPDLDPAALAVLLSPGYADERRRLITDTASRELRPGTAAGPTPYLPPLHLPTGEPTSATGEPTVRSSGAVRGDTCHVDVIDRWGNAVSATPSGGWLQSSPTVPELGFCLGTRLQMTHLDPRSPAALAPGRRPRTTLSPTVVRHGRDLTVLGTPGGDQQDQWQLPFLLRTVVGGQGQQQAIDAPLFHTTSVPSSFWPRAWEPGGLVVEDRVGAAVLDELEARGHTVTRAGAWTLGRLSAVRRNESTGTLWGAANARGAQGYAVGR